MALTAVITADIVNSTRLSRQDGKKLLKQLETVFASYQFEFFRGDSFQVFLKSPAEALPALLQARAVAIRLGAQNSATVCDVRASIGIGLAKTPIRSLPTANDEAFVLSGRSFDELKEGQRLIISSAEKNATINLGLSLVARFTDFIFQRMTGKQAAVVFELLQKRTQTDTAKRLKKSQATVHKHMQSAGWPEIEKLVKSYQELIVSIEA